MKSVKVKKLVTILEKNNFLLKRRKGSHFIYFNRITSITLIIPIHSKNKELPIGTFLSIVKQSRIPITEFK